MTDSDLADIREIVQVMKGHTVHNYVLPGLDSSLVTNGKVRLFESSRDTREFITPHSHRFDFVAMVLAGHVKQTLYVPYGVGDLWVPSHVTPVSGGLGDYVITPLHKPVIYSATTRSYKIGDTYRMRFDEIHSIKFSANSKVLMFEGPERSTTSVILEPWSHDKRVPTFKVEEWMFENGKGPDSLSDLCS